MGDEKKKVTLADEEAAHDLCADLVDVLIERTDSGITAMSIVLSIYIALACRKEDVELSTEQRQLAGEEMATALWHEIKKARSLLN